MGAKQKKVGDGTIITGDCIKEQEQFPEKHFQLIIADPPYFQVLLEQEWDMAWKDEAAYIDWCLAWARQCHRTLREDGLFYVFGPHGADLSASALGRKIAGLPLEAEFLRCKQVVDQCLDGQSKVVFDL
jgi:DNA modification methylase